MISLTLFALAFVILSIPTIYELWEDRHGETPDQKKKDVYKRVFLMSLASVIVGIIYAIAYATEINEGIKVYLIYTLKAMLLTFAIFFMFFDYVVILILVHRGIVELPKGKKWFSYLSKSPLDSVWSKWDWRLRMLIRGVVFVASIIVFNL